MANSKLLINPASIVRALATTAFVMVLLSIAAVSADGLTEHNSVILHKAVKFFYVDFELNAPSFFSTLILLIASAILAVITILKRQQKDLYTAEWAVLSIGFLAMAFDELLSVHERMIEPMQELLGNKNLGIFYFAWVIPMGILVLLLAVFFLRFWWNLPPKTRLHFMIAAAIFLGGAVGLELFESKHSEIYGIDTLTYIVLVTIEESLEMTGVIIFIKALFTYIKETFGELQLQLDNSQSESGLLALRKVKQDQLIGVSQKSA